MPFKGNVSEWDEDLPILTAAIRALPNRHTGLTPNLLMLGREVTQPVELVFEMKTNIVEREPPHEYAQNLKERMLKAHALARKNIGAAQNYQKKNYDLNRNYSAFEEGDIVYRLNKSSKTGQSRKLQPVWLGPLLVVEPLSPVLYKVRGRKKITVLHHDLLKKCEDREVPIRLRRMRNKLLGADGSEGSTVVHEGYELGDLFQAASKGCNENVQVEGEGVQPAKITTTRSGREVKLPARYQDGL